MNFTNCVEDGTQLFKYSREICYYHVSTIIFSMGNVTAMSEHQGKLQPTQMQRKLISCGILSLGLFPLDS
jgi:hypothetical protein